MTRNRLLEMLPLRHVSRAVRLVVPLGLLRVISRTRSLWRHRLLAAAGLVGFWSIAYARYRERSLRQSQREKRLLETATLEAFRLHYNERVPTIQEEFDLWGEYHQHRHEMRYDIVARAVDEHTPPGGAILDVGCGACLVADRVPHLRARYVGVEYGHHHATFAAKKVADLPGPLEGVILRGDAEGLPFPNETFDVVVMSEVIEHLMRPERAVWEVARVLRPGGVYVMTTNNASEVPLYSPLSHLLAWLEKAFGADHPRLISRRPWIWPEAVDPELLPPGTPPVYLPHTHHIQGETRRMFAAAGLETFHWSSFEFPPPQADMARWLDEQGEAGRRAVDVIEAVCQRTPLVRRLGCHLFMLCRKVGPPVAPDPPLGVWPGPFSSSPPRSSQDVSAVPAAMP